MFLILWVKQSTSDDEKAVTYGHIISGTGNCFGLVAAMLFGFLLDKKRVSIVKFN